MNYGEIEFMVDANKPMKIKSEELRLANEAYGSPMYLWEPKTVALHLYHGSEPNEGQKDCSYLSELMKGQELKVRYQTGSHNTNSFKANLHELKPLLIEAFGLEYCVK